MLNDLPKVTQCQRQDLNPSLLDLSLSKCYLKPYCLFYVLFVTQKNIPLHAALTICCPFSPSWDKYVVCFNVFLKYK